MTTQWSGANEQGQLMLPHAANMREPSIGKECASRTDMDVR